MLVHGVVDPALTYLFVVSLDRGRELNPLLRAGLEGGLGQFVGLHLGFFVVTAALFWGIVSLIGQGTPRVQHRLYRGSVGVLVGIILWGAAIVCWNLQVLLVS